MTSDFTEPVVSVELNETVSPPFANLAGYASLQPGGAYFWRVLAIDNEGLSTASAPRSFVYNSTTLTIAANFPGATTLSPRHRVEPDSSNRVPL